MNQPVKLKGGHLEDMPSSLDARDHYLVVRDQNGPINPPKLYVGPDGGGTPILPGGAELSEKAVEPVTSDYTLSSDDLGKTLVVTTNELDGPIVITCPDGISEGFHCTVVNDAEGILRFKAGGTASLNSSENGLLDEGAVTVENSGTNNWAIEGAEKVPYQTDSLSIEDGAALAVAPLQRRAIAGKSLVDLDAFSSLNSVSSLSGDPNGAIHDKEGNYLIGVTTDAGVFMWDLSDDSLSTADFSGTFSGEPTISIDPTRSRVVIFDGETIGVFDPSSVSITETKTISEGSQNCREMVYVEPEDLFMVSGAGSNSGFWFIDAPTLQAESFNGIGVKGISWIADIGLAYLPSADSSPGDFYVADPSSQSVQKKWSTSTGEKHYGSLETGGVLYTTPLNGSLFLWDPVGRELVGRLEEVGAPDRLVQDSYSGEILACSTVREGTLRKFDNLPEKRGAFPDRSLEDKPRRSSQKVVSSDYTLSKSDLKGTVVVSTSSTSAPVTITLPSDLEEAFECTVVNGGGGIVLVSAEGTLGTEGTAITDEGDVSEVIHEGGGTWSASNLSHVTQGSEINVSPTPSAFGALEIAEDRDKALLGQVMIDLSDDSKLSDYGGTFSSASLGSVAYAPPENTFYVADYANNQIGIVNAGGSEQLDSTVSVNGANPLDCIYNPLTEEVWVLDDDSSGTVEVVTTDNQSIDHTFTTTSGARAIYFVESRSEVLILDKANSEVLVYDAQDESQKYARSLNTSTAGDFWGLTYDPDRELIYCFANGYIEVVSMGEAGSTRLESVPEIDAEPDFGGANLNMGENLLVPVPASNTVVLLDKNTFEAKVLEESVGHVSAVARDPFRNRMIVVGRDGSGSAAVPLSFDAREPIGESPKESSLTNRTTKSSNYTLQSRDVGRSILMQTSSDSSPDVVTLPNGLPVGFEVRIVNDMGGTVAIEAEGTLQSEGTGLLRQGSFATVVHEGGNLWSASLENVPRPSGLDLGSSAKELIVVPGAQGDDQGAVVAANVSQSASDVVRLSDGSSAGSLSGSAPSAGTSYGSKAVFCGSALYQVPKSDLTGSVTQIASKDFSDVEYIPRHQTLIAFADSSNNAVVYDTTASPPSQVTTISLGEDVYYGAYSHKRDLLYLPGRSGTMMVVDPATNSLVQQKSVGTDFVDIAVYGSTIFAAQAGGNPIAALSAGDLSKVGEVGQGEHISRVGDYLYVCGPGATKGRVINARTLEEETNLNSNDTHNGSVVPLPWRGSVLIGSKDGAGSGLEYKPLP